MKASRVIVALDFADTDAARTFVQRVTPEHCRLKVGMELFTSAGPDLVKTLVSEGFDVFLDLKYHDIPTTVAKACAQAAGLGVWMLNVHALGGQRMLEAAREAVDRSRHHPLLLGVTLLTSHGDNDLEGIGLERGTARHVERLAGLVHGARLNGVVCSPREAPALRKKYGKEFLLVTPGVRPSGEGQNDQQRISTPVEAITAGADYLVIGRPITQASDPRAALDAVNREIAGV